MFEGRRMNGLQACVEKCETTFGCKSFNTDVFESKDEPFCTLRVALDGQTYAPSPSWIDVSTAAGYPRYSRSLTCRDEGTHIRVQQEQRERACSQSASERLRCLSNRDLFVRCISPEHLLTPNA